MVCRKELCPIGRDFRAFIINALPDRDDLASALRRAAGPGKHEKRITKADANWPDWYAEYLLKEHTGEELPQ